MRFCVIYLSLPEHDWEMFVRLSILFHFSESKLWGGVCRDSVSSLFGHTSTLQARIVFVGHCAIQCEAQVSRPLSPEFINMYEQYVIKLVKAA